MREKNKVGERDWERVLETAFASFAYVVLGFCSWTKVGLEQMVQGYICRSLFNFIEIRLWFTKWAYITENNRNADNFVFFSHSTFRHLHSVFSLDSDIFFPSVFRILAANYFLVILWCIGRTWIISAWILGWFIIEIKKSRNDCFDRLAV